MSTLITTTAQIGTIKDAGGNANAMTISSGGVISQPNNPCFHVGKNADQTLNDGTVTVITFESVTDGGESGVIINRGGLFASNKFTVTSTTTGMYYFYTSLFVNSSVDASDTYVYFRKNGSQQMQTGYPNLYTSSGAYFSTLQVYGLINLSSASDYVEVVIDCDQAGGNTLLVNYNSGYHRTEFGGYKVG